ncbi:MAG TPA: YafY family protein [Ktedonobacterales bacterium]
MSYSTGRVLAVLELLQSYGRMRGEDLAVRLEVDVRTIRRYVTSLRDQGMPVEMERGRHGGYFLRPGFKLPLALTEHEALTMAYGLMSARRQQPEPDAQGSAQALVKLTRALPPATRAMMRDIQRAVTFAGMPGAPAEPLALERLKTLASAIATSRRIALTYSAWTGAQTERVVDPFQVVHRNGRWYLAGYCHLREDMRVFRVERMLNIAILQDEFEPRAVDAPALVEQAIARAPWRWSYNVRLDMPLEAARERISPTIAELAEADGAVEMRGYSDDLTWIATYLINLRCHFVVVAPPELYGHLRELADHLQALVAEPAPR